MARGAEDGQLQAEDQSLEVDEKSLINADDAAAAIATPTTTEQEAQQPSPRHEDDQMPSKMEVDGQIAEGPDDQKVLEEGNKKHILDCDMPDTEVVGNTDFTIPEPSTPVTTCDPMKIDKGQNDQEQMEDGAMKVEPESESDLELDFTYRMGRELAAETEDLPIDIDDDLETLSGRIDIELENLPSFSMPVHSTYMPAPAVPNGFGFPEVDVPVKGALRAVGNRWDWHCAHPCCLGSDVGIMRNTVLVIKTHYEYMHTGLGQ